MKKPTGKDVKILRKRVGWGVYEKTLSLTHQSRKSKKEGYFLRHNLENLVVLARNHVDVIATQKNKFDDLSQNIWRRLGARMTDNSVDGGLHRAGRNFEWLQKIAANPYRDHDRNQNHFAVFSPMRFPRYRCEFVERLIKSLRCAVNFLPVSRAHGFAKRLHFGDDLFPVGATEFVVLITK